jgi:4-hydroxy-tetrahydrodipicolinate reductase
MGRSLETLIRAATDLHVVGGIARTGRSVQEAQQLGLERVVDVSHAIGVLDYCDVLIDFSSPAFLAELLERYQPSLAGKAVVVGTTGLDDRAQSLLNQTAQTAAVLVASNFSRGVSLLMELAERAARALPPADYDAEIIEAHHRGKVDAPSGTALSLGEAVARGHGRERTEHRVDGRSGRTGERPRGEIGFHSVRGGSVIGEHHVLFLGTRERIELTHIATDRALFADGALAAARWLAPQPPGRYTMADFLGL